MTNLFTICQFSRSLTAEPSRISAFWVDSDNYGTITSYWPFKINGFQYQIEIAFCFLWFNVYNGEKACLQEQTLRFIHDVSSFETHVIYGAT